MRTDLTAGSGGWNKPFCPQCKQAGLSANRAERNLREPRDANKKEPWIWLLTGGRSKPNPVNLHLTWFSLRLLWKKYGAVVAVSSLFTLWQHTWGFSHCLATHLEVFLVFCIFPSQDLFGSSRKTHSSGSLEPRSIDRSWRFVKSRNRFCEKRWRVMEFWGML